MKDSEDASRLDRDVMGGEATVARRHIRVKARRGPGCLLMAIFQGDLYVGGCREHSGPFLVWHEAFSWTLDQLAARPEADKAPPSHDRLLTLVRDLTRRLAPGRRRNRFWALPRAWLQRLRRAGLRLPGSHVCLLDKDGALRVGQTPGAALSHPAPLLTCASGSFEGWAEVGATKPRMNSSA